VPDLTRDLRKPRKAPWAILWVLVSVLTALMLGAYVVGGRSDFSAWVLLVGLAGAVLVVASAVALWSPTLEERAPSIGRDIGVLLLILAGSLGVVILLGATCASMMSASGS
jgi:hypothetical protein